MGPESLQQCTELRRPNREWAWRCDLAPTHPLRAQPIPAECRRPELAPAGLNSLVVEALATAPAFPDAVDSRGHHSPDHAPLFREL